MGDGLNVFVLAHPDDEVFFWPLIARTPSEKLAIIFLTDGSAGGGVRPSTRIAETRDMLARRRIDPQVALFLGVNSGLSDGLLHTMVDRAWAALLAWANKSPTISSVFTHAWEGGHQDHDVCHALALALARLCSVEQVRQVACYRRPDAGIAPFSLLDPIAANGLPENLAMTAAERMVMARSISCYPSQWKSWMGLGPPLLTRLTLSSHYPLQPISVDRLRERPHAKPLLYELRGGPSFDAVLAAVGALQRGGF